MLRPLGEGPGSNREEGGAVLQPGKKPIELEATLAGVDGAREVFRPVIQRLTGLSPRDAKRLVNGVLMAGAGARLANETDDAGEEASSVTDTLAVSHIEGLTIRGP